MNKAVIISLVVSSVLLAACGKKTEPTPTPTPTPLSETGGGYIVETGVVLEQPDDGDAVTSPMNVEGLAPGTWFFEGQLEGEVLTQDGLHLATFPLTATSEWMTEEHVHFQGTAEFEVPVADDYLQLVIKNSNPSGLPENEKSQTFKVLVQQPPLQVEQE